MPARVHETPSIETLYRTVMCGRGFLRYTGYMIIPVLEHGLFVTGPPSEEESFTETRAWMENIGWSPEEVTDVLSRVTPQLAWWGGWPLGWVYETHPEAIAGNAMQMPDKYLSPPEE